MKLAVVVFASAVLPTALAAVLWASGQRIGAYTKLLAGLEGPLPTAATAPVAAGETGGLASHPLMAQSDCYTCHQVDSKLVGPSFRAIAIKYRDRKGALDRLAKKVRLGGSGDWGSVPMAAHPNLKAGDERIMVRWILALNDK
jgi:cytochrome c